MGKGVLINVIVAKTVDSNVSQCIGMINKIVDMIITTLESKDATIIAVDAGNYLASLRDGIKGSNSELIISKCFDHYNQVPVGNQSNRYHSMCLLESEKLSNVLNIKLYPRDIVDIISFSINPSKELEDIILGIRKANLDDYIHLDKLIV